MHLPKQAPPVQRPSSATHDPAKDKVAGLAPQADCVCRLSPTLHVNTLQCIIGRSWWDTLQLC